MRLISCNIDGFGCWVDRKFDFENNLTCFCEENGYGKSTLAAFIRTMFYGLATQRGQSFNDRTHYQPDGSGKFGGSLIFEWKGSRYRIERSFDKKSATKDACSLQDGGGNALQIPDEGLGAYFFGIDEDSFVKTLFVGDLTVDVSNSASINRKLNNIENDLSSDLFEKAKGALDKAMKSIKPQRKSQTNPGRLAEIEADILSAQGILREKQAVQERIPAQYDELKAAQVESDRLSKELEAASAHEKLQAQWSDYDNRLETVENLRGELSSVVKKYPSGLPSLDDVKSLEELEEKRSKSAAVLGHLSFNDGEKLEKLQKQFATPTDMEKIKDVRGKIVTLASKEEQLKRPNPVDSTLDALKRKFNFGLPSEVEMEGFASKSGQFAGNRRRIESLMDSVTKSVEVVVKPSKVLPLLLLFFGIVAAVASALLRAESLPVAAWASIGAVGLVLIVVSVALFCRKGGTEQRLVENEEVKNEISHLKADNSALEESLKPFYSKYGFFGDSYVDYANQLRVDVDNYRVGIAEEKRFLEDKNKLREEAETLKEECGKYLRLYLQNEPSSLSQGLDEVEEAFNALLSLQQKKLEYENGCSRLNKEIEEYDNSIAKLLTPLGLADGYVKGSIKSFDMRSDLEKVKRLKEEILKGEEATAKFKLDNNLVERPAPAAEGRSKDDISKMHSDQLLRVHDIESQIDRNEELSEGIAEVEEKISLLQDRLAGQQHKLEVLKKVMDHVNSAENSRLEKFVKPVQSSYEAIAARLAPALGEDVVMSYGFSIKLKDGGLDPRRLSSGQSACMKLCLRLAIIEHLYKEEPPFLILDDPFIGLDENHFKRAATILKELSGNTQMLYFTCHESRKVS